MSTSERYFHRAFGFTIASPYAATQLEQLDAAAGATADVEVTARRLSEPLPIPDRSSAKRLIEASPTRITVTIPHIATLDIRDGNRINMAIAPDAERETAAAFLQTLGYSAIGLQRRVLMLRAAAVRQNGRAILICGPSTAYSSAIAAHLHMRDPAKNLILADSLAALKPGETSCDILPGESQLRLWKPTVDALGLDASALNRVRPELPCYWLPSAQRSTESVTVSHLYILNGSSQEAITITPEKASALPAKLQPFIHHIQLIAQTDSQVFIFKQITGLARALSMSTVTINESLHSTASIASAIHDDQEQHAT